jgi:fimbrial chaperone protein
MLFRLSKWGFSFGCLFAILCTSPALAGAGFRLSPPTVEFSPIGRDIVKNFYIRSTGDEPVAVQVTINKWEVAPDGTETNPPEDEDFLIYPPQMIVQPGSEQVVRVTWVGEGNIPKEQTYRAVFEQVPINFVQTPQEVEGKGQISLSVIFKYVAAVYLTPEGAKPEILIESSELQENADGSKNLLLVFNNVGNARGSLKDTAVKLTSSVVPTTTVTIPGAEVRDEKGVVILAGNKRRFVLPWPKELPVGPVTATFTTN